ncbi:hypothetical protein DDE20_01615 [Pararhodobacter oceanensis]|uniref:DUF2497 domain-containing protein n=2 Tax=Pararhodobacter oceanensis TaxID=2172121 RepID=A0A2T8HXY9_9RHOB|nr:hypothetical protein DDE20_01615 [Pararhodobacter oceanensis]
MTNREIEDVLTSIRRLVAQEGSEPPATGRLILTEAQRINAATAANTDSIEPRDVAAPQAPDHPVRPAAPEAPSAQSTPATPATEFTAAMLRGAPSASSEPALQLGDAAPAPDFVAGAAAADEAGEVSDTTSEDSASGLPVPDFGMLEATIAELEAAVSASGETWEPDTETGEAPRPSNVTDLYGRLTFARGNNAPISLAEDQTPAPQKAPEDAPTGDASTTTDGAAASFTHHSAEAAAPQARGPENAPELDHPSEPEVAPEAPMETDATAADPTATAGAQASTAESEFSAADDDTFVDDPGDTIIDEDTLRVVVAQIVREELHGQLGERVTQQIRKLVRAEIAKALEGRDFL